MNPQPLLLPDHPALVSRADLIYRQPVEHGRQGHPIGNGRMGTMVWTTPDAVCMRINRNDVFSVNGNHKGSKAGPADYWGGCAKIRLDVGGDVFRDRDGFTQHLSLYEAEEVIEGDNVVVRCFVASGRDVLVLEIDDCRPEPQALRVDLSMWRDPIVVNGDHTASYAFNDLQGAAAVVQQFTEAEYYCGSAVAAQIVGEGTVDISRSDRCQSMSISAVSGKRLILVSSAASWDADDDLLATTGVLLNEAVSQTYTDLRAAHASWWAELWSRTFVHLTSDDGVADFMQCVRTLQLYYMASSSRGRLPAKWNGSLFLTEGDTTYWGSQFWVWTTQISYYPLHAADAVELTNPFFNMYVNQLPNAVRAGEQRTGAPGAYILESGQFDGPVVLPDDVAAEYRDVWLGRKPSSELSPKAATYGTFDGGLLALDTSRFEDRKGFPQQAVGRYSWVSHIATSGCKIAKHAWWRYRYTGDRQWLRSRAYPLLRETLEFYRGLARKEEDGTYHLYGLNQFEGSWGTDDGLLDLTAIRGTAPLAIKAAEILDVDADLRAAWAEFLDNLAPYPMGSDPESHNAVAPDLWSLGHVGAIGHPRKKGYIRISQRDEVGEGAVVPGMGARLECAEPLRNLLRDVYVSDGKEDHIVECVECAESAGSVLDDLDDSVEAFGDGVGKTRVHECEDAEEVLSQGPDELSQGFKSTSECGRRPAFQEAFGSPGRFVFPELLELVLESPGSIDSVVRLLQCFECPSIPSGACR